MPRKGNLWVGPPIPASCHPSCNHRGGLRVAYQVTYHPLRQVKVFRSRRESSKHESQP